MNQPPLDPDRSPRSISPLAGWIDRQPRMVLAVYAMVAAFTAYTSMYAFRKPLAANSYEGLSAFSLGGTEFEYKAIALVSQLLGYMCSKFLGIKFASEMPFSRRAPIVLGLIGFAGLMLVLFGMIPAPYNIICLFFNGLPLGMVWSMLFGILEGRRVTEFLGLSMSVSVVFASGWVKAVGLWTVQHWGVDPFWMPALTGLLFVPLLLLSLGMLACLPPPDQLDIQQRAQRNPMKRAERRAFLRSYFFGVVMLVTGYLCLMAYRALRDDFMDVILADLGHEVQASDFAGIESLVGVCVIGVLGFLWFFRNNRMAVWANMTLVGLGGMLTGLSTVLLQSGILDPRAFYLINGVGLYIAYVPFQSILIDRLLASLQTVATAAFLIAIGDSFGYIAVVVLYLTKNIYTVVTDVAINWAGLMMFASYVVATLVPLTMLTCAIYFRRHFKD